MCRLSLLFAAMFAVSAASRADDDDLLRQVQTLPLDRVEGRIDHMSLSSDARQLAVAELGNNSVEILDTSKLVSLGRINGIKEPQGVCLIPDSGKLAVASGGDGNVRIYTA